MWYSGVYASERWCLSELLFLLYINDLPQVCHYSKCLMYADDTVLFLSDSNPDTINSKLSSDLQSLHKWLNDNHLTINVTKTKCMYFHSSRKHLSFTSPIIFSNQHLVITNTYKYLGVLLDSHLTYREHTSKLTKKLNQKLYVYNKIRPYLSSTVSKTYLHAIVFSTISYCIPIWSLTTKEITESIARLYNRALKIHCNLPKWTHHCTALTQSHALSFQNFIYSHAITFYFQLQHSTSQTLISLLPTHNMPKVRVTRSVSMALHPVPAFNNGYGQRSFIHTFTKVWNGIPHHIRVVQSITQFKKAYKLLLLNTYTCKH